jgi:hypothetical protein
MVPKQRGKVAVGRYNNVMMKSTSTKHYYELSPYSLKMKTARLWKIYLKLLYNRIHLVIIYNHPIIVKRLTDYFTKNSPNEIIYKWPR